MHLGQAMRLEVMSSSPVQLVVRLRCALAANDYVGFFRGVRNAPYLLACLVHAYFPAARAAACAAICTGGTETQEPVMHGHTCILQH
jgi:SAC3/GANP family